MTIGLGLELARRAAGLALLAAGAGAMIAQPAAAQIYQRAVGAASGEVAYDILETRDCGYVTVGETGLTAAGGPGGLHAMKFRYEGVLQWSKFLPGNARSTGTTVHECRTVPPGYIVGGESALVANMGILLVRLDTAGNGLWTRLYSGTPFLDSLAGVSVRELADGTIAAVGRFEPAGGASMGVLLRVDPAGNPLFQRVYVQAGGGGRISFTDLREVAAPVGGLLIVGTLTDPATGLEQALLLQTDVAGNPIVAFSYTAALPNAVRLFGDGMDMNAAGDVVVSGRMGQVGALPQDTLVWRLDAAFNAMWAAQVFRTVNGFQAVEWTNEPAVIVAGTQPAILGPPPIATLARFSPGGVPSLSRYYGAPGATEGHGAIHPLRRLTFSLAGRTAIPPIAGGTSDTYLVVANPGGDTPCLATPGPPAANLQLLRVPRQIVSTFQQGMQVLPPPVDYLVANTPYCSIGCPADFDGNGVVTPADIAAFVNNWNASIAAGNFGGDFDCNGIVAPADIALFVSTWNSALALGCP
jgi:hypothetical protein